MKLTIEGNTPSQKNRKIISVNQATGRPFLRSAKAVKDWQKFAADRLTEQFRGCVVRGYPVTVTLVFYFDSKRRHDLDNATSTVMDALVAAAILTDDSTKYVDCLQIQYGGVDKLNPRAEVFLDE